MRVPAGPGTRVLLCDADGTLFGSEEPAFQASSVVTNRLLEQIGSDRRFTGEELRKQTSGQNFRATASAITRRHGKELDHAELERWVGIEQRQVTAHLAAVLEPEPDVTASLERLSERFELAVVTSSARRRLDVCLDAAGLASLFPDDRRFSAEDSLAVPESKPSPAIYRFAGTRLGLESHQAVAIEDTISGVRSAVGAGFATLGMLMFVPPDERLGRGAKLLAADARTIVSSWAELEDLLVGEGALSARP